MITPPLVRKVFLTTFAFLMMAGLALASGPVFWETAKQDDVVRTCRRVAEDVTLRELVL